MRVSLALKKHLLLVTSGVQILQVFLFSECVIVFLLLCNKEDYSSINIVISTTLSYSCKNLLSQ